MAEPEEKLSPTEEHLLAVMKALDNQVAREMQRSPADKELHGVQKWEPINRRIEKIASFVLNSLGDNSVELDSLLILAQAMSKSLQLVIEDLGEEGLGALRSEYCLQAMKNIEDHARRGADILKGGYDVI